MQAAPATIIWSARRPARLSLRVNFVQRAGMIAESFESILYKRNRVGQRETPIVAILDAVIEGCSHLSL